MHRYLVYNPDCDLYNGCIIPDNYNHSLDAFEFLSRLVRADFPELRWADLECRTVVRSIRSKGCPMITFQVHGGRVIPDGWIVVDDLEELAE